MIHDGHFVLRQSARFVRTDDLRAPKRFHGGQALDDGFFLRHFGHPERKHDGDDGRQTFGNSGYRQRYGDDEAVQNDLERKALFENQLENKDEDTDSQHEETQYLGKLVEPLLQRRHFVFGLRENVGDLAHLRLHPRGDDYRLCSAVDDGAAHIYHIFSVA